MTGLETTDVTTMTMSRTLAVAGESPCPATRNGKPHSIVNMLAANCDVKCDHSPSRVPGTSHAARSVRAIARRRSSSRWWSVYGLSLTTGHERDPAEDAHRRRDGIRRRPPEAGERGCQRAGRGERAELSEDAGQLRDHRRASRREPQRDEAQHRDEDHRVAHPEQHAAQQRGLEGVDERETELRDRQQREAEAEQLLGAVAVEQRPDRQLHRRIDEELQDGEGRQLRAADAEAVGGIEPGDAERRAVEDGQDVDGDGRRPDRPGTAAVEGVALPRLGRLGRSRHPVSRAPQFAPVIGMLFAGALGTQSTIALATVLLMSGWKTLGMM